MSDDLRRAFDEMRQDLGAVKVPLDDVEARLSGAEQSLRQAHEGIQDMNRTHDTDQLQRVTAVENDDAMLREQWQDLARRVEALEKRSPPAA